MLSSCFYFQLFSTLAKRHLIPILVQALFSGQLCYLWYLDVFPSPWKLLSRMGRGQTGRETDRPALSPALTAVELEEGLQESCWLDASRNAFKRVVRRVNPSTSPSSWEEGQMRERKAVPFLLALRACALINGYACWLEKTQCRLYRAMTRYL